jgi:NRPS condensation-like uncharacterized protein
MRTQRQDTRAPFSIVEQWIFHLDQESEPWSVHCEVRVAGRLDSDRLAAAALAAAARHPMARARMARFRPGDHRYWWEIPDLADHLSLEILDCPDDAALDDARDRLESMDIDLGSSPPFALTLAHRPGGDSLLLNLHHAAADGIGAYRLLTSIARAYAGAEDPVPDVNPLDVRDVRWQVGSRGVRDGLIRARELGDRVCGGAPARIARQGPGGAVTGYGFRLLRLGPEETEVVTQRRRDPATVNDLLVAALAIAVARFNSERDIPTGRVSVMTPVNLRPPAWSGEVVANILSFVSVSVPASERSDLAGTQLAVEARTRAQKARRLPGAVIDVLGLASVTPVGLRQFLARTVRHPISDKFVDTAILSNLGRLDQPLDFGPEAGTATEIWFSPPGQMPLGAGIGVATMNGEMFLTVRYCRAQFDATGARAFAEAWREVLLGG